MKDLQKLITKYSGLTSQRAASASWLVRLEINMPEADDPRKHKQWVATRHDISSDLLDGGTDKGKDKSWAEYQCHDVDSAAMLVSQARAIYGDALLKAVVSETRTLQVNL